MPNRVSGIGYRVSGIDLDLDLDLDRNQFDMDLQYVSDPALLKRLKTLVKKTYLALGGAGYGRADIRMNQDGELFLLEINPNPSVLNMPAEQASAASTL